MIQDVAAFGFVDEFHKNFAEASGVEFPHDAHVGETVIRAGEGVPRLAFVLRQNDARDMHVGEFIDGAPGGTDGEVHAFHHAGHDVGGVLETEQRIAELQTSVRYSRTSVSRERVMSDWRIAMAEQKQPKRLVDSNESLRRKNKYGMIRDEQDAAVE